MLTTTTLTHFGRPDLANEYLAPRNDIERELAGLYQDLLGVEQVGVSDDFFDLGGHSLVAVRLFARVKKKYGVDFPLSILFETATIEGLARVIADELGIEPNASAHVWRGRRGEFAVAGISQPFHESCVDDHRADSVARPADADLLARLATAATLPISARWRYISDSDQPFFGLQHRGVDGRQKPHHDVRDMAAEYIADIRQVQSAGPYVLAGYSGGGTAIFEMAHQLSEAGERVAALLFFDAYSPVIEGARAEQIGLRSIVPACVPAAWRT